MSGSKSYSITLWLKTSNGEGANAEQRIGQKLEINPKEYYN